MKIGIFGSVHQVGKQGLIRNLFDKLHSLGAGIYVDEPFYYFLKQLLGCDLKKEGLITDDTFEVDIALSVGGDGTFLRTASRVKDKGIPILGINTGRLGFLADISSNEIDVTLDELFKNYYRIEERALLQLTTKEKVFETNDCALNEIAILKRDTSSMITIHAYLDDDYLTSYQADGLVVATPTGSTAYSMSVNGPIIVPQSNSFVLSPVAPHSLNVRPLVIPDTTVIKLSVETRSDSFLVALDGRSEVFPDKAEFMIRKADCCTRVIKRHNHTFYNTLREKLMWGADARKK